MSTARRRGEDDPERLSRGPRLEQQLDGLALFTPAQASRETLAAHVDEHGEHRRRLLEAFRVHGRMTADEAGERCGLTPFQARPRVTQLVKMGKLQPTGERGVSALGNPAAILEVVP